VLDYGPTEAHDSKQGFKTRLGIKRITTASTHPSLEDAQYFYARAAAHSVEDP